MELLAPAGNFTSLKAAIACGADAVYLGMEKYGARASADNFNAENLLRAIELCKLHDVKLYLTVNTLLKDGELDDAVNTVRFAQHAGADAFIVQDLGLIAALKSEVPQAVLHASTQMGISNAYGAEFARKLGIKRVVLARETLPSDISDIKSKSGLEIEVFCHGALCVAYSGNCYYSSLVSGCSGNRGRCLQLCRKKYSIGKESGYFLSAKDICLIDKVKMLADLGVDSLKIEGRMRASEYVAETVTAYRRAIDGVSSGDDLIRLKKVFNRGDYCKAYLLAPTENVVFSKVQNNIGIKAGVVKAVKGGKLDIAAIEKLEKGDGVKYLRDGYEVGGGTVDGMPTGYRGNVRAGDEVRLTSSAELGKKAAELDPKVNVSVTVSMEIGAPASIALTCKNVTVTVLGKEIVREAVNCALTETDVIKAVGQLGGTDFTLCDISVNIARNAFYPASLIKAIRACCVARLKEKLLNRGKKLDIIAAKTATMPRIDWFPAGKSAVFVQTDDIDKLGKIGFHYDYVVLNPVDYGDTAAIKRMAESEKLILNLPFVVRGDDIAVLQKLKEIPFEAVVANNICELELFSDSRIIGGIGLNHLNSRFGGTFVNSVESDCMGKGINYVYGKPPLMHFAHCPRKNRGGKCADCKGYCISMRDDKGAVVNLCRIKEKLCYGILVPDLPIDNISRNNDNAMFMDITYATDEEIKALNAKMLGDYSSSVVRCTHGNINRKLQ